MEQIIDKMEAIQKAGGKADLAKELFGMLLNELPGLKDLMNDAYLANNNTDFWNHVHKIHGSTAYCGVPALKHSAKSLEDAIKQDKSFPEMKNELNQLNLAIDNLLKTGELELKTDWS